MLILTRRPGESIIIDNPASAIDSAGGEPITVTVLGVKGNQIRIGIDAPKDITILREELISRQQPVSAPFHVNQLLPD